MEYTKTYSIKNACCHLLIYIYIVENNANKKNLSCNDLRHYSSVLNFSWELHCNSLTGLFLLFCLIILHVKKMTPTMVVHLLQN